MTENNGHHNGIALLRNVMSMVTLVQRVVDRRPNLPGMACYFGPSGYGKSSAATYAANVFDAYQVQIQSTWTKKTLCQAILRDLGIEPERQVADMVTQIAAEIGSTRWAIRFSEEWYRLQMPPLKAAFEDDHIALIADSEHVSDLRMVKLIRGIPRVPPVREGEKGRKRHGDYAIALALAYFASRMRWVEYGYVPVPVHDQRVGHNGGPAMFGSEEEGWWRGPLGARLRGSI
jgi:hypothetical protein